MYTRKETVRLQVLYVVDGIDPDQKQEDDP